MSQPIGHREAETAPKSRNVLQRTKDDGQGGRRRASPSKPKRLKLLLINDMGLWAEKQTQMRYPAYSQMVADRNRPIFDENGCSSHRIGARSGTNPSKPKRVRAHEMNKISLGKEKQTQLGYLASYQCEEEKNGPFFGEDGWLSCRFAD